MKGFVKVHIFTYPKCNCTLIIPGIVEYTLSCQGQPTMLKQSLCCVFHFKQIFYKMGSCRIRGPFESFLENLGASRGKIFHSVLKKIEMSSGKGSTFSGKKSVTTVTNLREFSCKAVLMPIKELISSLIKKKKKLKNSL